jgi:hypothetical protein
MKVKNLYLLMLLVLSGFMVLQGCKKEDEPAPLTFVAAMPANPDPGNESIVPFAGTPVTLHLKWEGTATNPIKWDVYFGNTDKPVKIASNVSGNTYDVTVDVGGTYYWKVGTVDANNVTSVSNVWSVIVNSSPDLPSHYLPADLATNASVSSRLRWMCSDPEGDDITYRIYMGKTADALAIIGQVKNDTMYTPTLDINTTYFWRIDAIDANGAKTEGPVSSFTTGTLSVFSFVGDYDVAEASVQNGNYAYKCTFTKIDNTTIQTDNWWDNGWTIKFVLDYAKNTFTIIPATFVSGANTYYVTGSGKIDQTTGKITLTYMVMKNGVLFENGVDTFTKSL